MTIRTDIVEHARAWIETPYQHQARMRVVGCDCLGLLVGVARELGLVAPDFDVNGYARQPDGRSMIELCSQYLRRIDPNAMAPGDVVSISFPRRGSVDVRPQHLGILGDYRHGGFSLIHAAQNARPPRVIEHRLLFHAGMRLSAAFAFPGVD